MTEAPLDDDPAIRIDQDVEEVLERFDAAWQEGRKPAINHYLPPGDPSDPQDTVRRRMLDELIKVDMEYRWRRRRRGKATHRDASTIKDKARAQKRRVMPARPHLEDYVRQFPELGSLELLPLELIAEEYRVRSRWGDQPEREIYLARFPNREQELTPALNEVEEELSRLPADETTISRSDVLPADEEPPSRGRNKKQKMPIRIGRYSIRKELGRGAFGFVYLAFDEELQRQVAIKVPREERLRKPKDMQAIVREARLAAQLRHPALVEVYDVGREESGRCFIVMEYIEGQPLNQIIRAQRVDRTQAAQWILRIAEAVHCAHKVGLVHADLKPGNILIDRESQPHVADFGLAVSESDQRRLARHVAGTPAYMSPEQVRGESHRVDGRTDLWSLGAIFYEMLTGRMPFTGDSVEEIFDEIQFRDPKPPRQIDDAIEPAFEEICLRCLSKQVTQRYTTATDLARDLAHALEDTTLGSPTLLGSQRYASGELSSIGFARSRSTAPSSHTRAPQSNLPTPVTSFIGRERELEELGATMLLPGVWLVTLIGPGGIGKTRLAQRLGRDLLNRFPGGCWFAELESARTSSAVAHAVASAFGVPLTGSESAEQVVANVLEYRKPLLLILDNFEQAVEHAHTTVGLWQQRAPHVRFLATSRSPLGLRGEREYELGPLPTPREAAGDAPHVEEISAFDSVKLFLDRACEIDPTFQLDDANAKAVAQICTGLEGIPLAVELAAARVKILKPEQMAQMLGQKFRLLQSARRDLPARQKTLEGAIDWSYSLLNDWEKQAVMQSSIFEGGFSLEAAEQVIDLSAFADAPLGLDVIQSLREKSLVTRQDTRYQARFGMYQSIREYAQDKWRQTADPQAQHALGERFARIMLDYARFWDSRLHTAAACEALDRLQADMINLFAVEDWALANGQPETAARAMLAVAQTMAIRGPADRRVSRLERSLAALPESSGELRLNLLAALSDACQAVGAWDRAVALADQAVELSQPLGPVRLRAVALLQQGEMRRHRGDVEAAYTCFVQSESIFRQLDDRHGLARSLAGRGIVLWQRGDSEQALRCYDEATAIADELHDPIGIATVSRHRGHVLWQRGDYNGALKCYAEAERIARELGDERTLYLTIGNRGVVLADQGDYEGALQCYAEAETIARKLGDKRGIAMNIGNRGIALSDRGDPQAALECYREAEAINRQMQTKFGIAVNIGNRGNAQADLGDFAEALKSFDDAETLNREMGNKFLISLNIGDRGAALLKMGRAPEARDALREALALLDELATRHSPEYFGYQSLLAQCEQSLGNPVVAAILANEALHLAAQLGFSENHPKLRTRGQLAALRQIVEQSSGSGSPPAV